MFNIEEVQNFSLNFDNSNEEYFKECLKNLINASNQSKERIKELNAKHQDYFDKTEKKKLEFIKDNKTNDDFFNLLSYEEKNELLAFVKEALGFIYYPGCGDIYEIKNYEEKLDVCHDVYELCKIKFIAKRDEQSKTELKNRYYKSISERFKEFKDSFMIRTRK